MTQETQTFTVRENGIVIDQRTFTERHSEPIDALKTTGKVLGSFAAYVAIHTTDMLLKMTDDVHDQNNRPEFRRMVGLPALGELAVGSEQGRNTKGQFQTYAHTT